MDGRLLVSDGGKLRVAHEALLRRWDRARGSLRRLADAELRKARLQRALAIAAAVVFLAVAGVAVRQTQIAERNEQRSFDALARIFAERAWQAMARSDYPLAARYAVAGARISPASAGDFRSVLGRLLHEAGESRFLVGHEGPVESVAFSKDGTRILSVGSIKDSTARLWDATSGQTLLVLNGPEEEPPRTLNPFTRLARAREKLSRGPRPRWGLLQAVFSPDDASIATAMNDGTVHVVEAASGRETLLLSGHEGQIARVAFSPDGTRIVVADRTSAHVWNAQDGRKIAVLRGHENLRERKNDPNRKRSFAEVDEQNARAWMHGLIQDAAFSPDGARVVTASQDGTARIWDAASGREIAVLRDGGLVKSAAFSPDGARVVTASSRAARIWDATSGREITILGGREVYSNVLSASMNRDGTRIVTTQTDNSARVWDAESGHEIAVLRGHQGILHAAAFSMRGGLVVTASSDRSVRIWDATNGEEIARLRGHSGAVRSAAFSPDGQSVVSASDDGSLRIWEAQGRTIEHIVFEEDDPVISETFETFSRDGERILSIRHFRDERAIRLWSFETPHPILTLRGHTDWIHDVVFSPDGTRIASTFSDNTVRVWDAASGREIAVLRGHERGAESIRFSPDGRRLVTAGRMDETTRIWDAESGREIAVLRHPQHGNVKSAAFSFDGARIVTGTFEAARVWDAATGREITAVELESEHFRDATFSRPLAKVG